MIVHDLQARQIPPVIDSSVTAAMWPAHRQDLIDNLSRHEYGFSPAAPPQVSARLLGEERGAFAGKADHLRIELSFPTPRGEFSFPVDLVLPRSEGKLPMAVYLSFTPYPGYPYVPVEEIVDNGYALALFCYHDVTRDQDDAFQSGLAGHFDRAGDDGTQWGKIAMWAWAASRVLDHVLTLDQVDAQRIFVIGHSRLGKTALWCAAQNTRFAGAVANNSGCSGAAITRGKAGERVQDIVRGFPHWFCRNYHAYAGREQDMPFEQNQLLAALAPRLVCTGSAVEDLWADPQSEFLACLSASDAYARLGLPGFIQPGRYAQPGEAFHQGRIGYHLRAGTHFLSRYDWQQYLSFMDRHLLDLQKTGL